MSPVKRIGPFLLDESQTTMQYGYYYSALFNVPFAQEKRCVRVWLPEDYFENQNKKYPVIYFADGQNLVNQNLCAFGCWKLDLVAHSHSLSFIAVGIEQKAGYYECKNCHHRYVPTYWQTNLAMHIGRTRYMKCPECGKRSWQKKVLTKED